MHTELPYQKLFFRLKKEIGQSVYKVGDLLPSENELSTLHKVARSTVRLALEHLQKEGLIEKRKGKGSIVASPVKTVNLLNSKGFSHTAIGDVETKVLEQPLYADWPDPFLFPLKDLELQSRCVRLSRVRLLNNQPVMYETTWLPNLNLTGFTRKFDAQHSLFDFLFRQYQIEVDDMVQEMYAEKANANIALQLGLDCHDAVIKIHRKYLTNRPYYQFYSQLFYNTNQFPLGNRFDNYITYINYY